MLGNFRIIEIENHDFNNISRQHTLAEEHDGAGVVKTRRQDEEQIVDEQRLVVQVELHRLVVQLHVCNLQSIYCPLLVIHL